MAGYIFSLDNIDSLRWCVENGVYSTNLKKPKNGNWQIYHEGTFADYIGMKPDDNIYFFIKRKIYGIGRLVNVGYDCKYQNYPSALNPSNEVKLEEEVIVTKCDDKSERENRVLCTFIPSPNFFQCGIDMDDVLASNPSKFKMLRAFWKVSFIKVDDEENKALKDIILKRNEEFINNTNGTYEFKTQMHERIQCLVNHRYKVSSREILKYASNGSVIKHEMAIEAGIIDCISNGITGIFGNWDYISHQVVASPFKPVDYMDKMDVFAYRYIPSFHTISKYLVIEIKKDKATKDAVDQIMKYVDWINQEYSYGDYSMIEAFIVAYDFPNDVIEYKNQICIRNYIRGRRPVISETWTNIKLIKYSYNQDAEDLCFEEV